MNMPNFYFLHLHEIEQYDKLQLLVYEKRKTKHYVTVLVLPKFMRKKVNKINTDNCSRSKPSTYKNVGIYFTVIIRE